MSIINAAASFSHHILAPDSTCPNNLLLPVLYYKHVLHLPENAQQAVEDLWLKNGWANSWTNGIFTYHHYHSTAHEVLAVIAGNCMLELGGDDGNIQTLSKGDVIILPAGVAHKNVGASADFVCMGAYPTGQEYDMNYCKAEEMANAIKNIEALELPEKDPVFGDDGPLINLWKHQPTIKLMDEENQF